MKWIIPLDNQSDAFNLDCFCHIWIKKSIHGKGYYIEGEFTHNGEEVIISPYLENEEQAKKYLLKLTKV